MTSIQYYHSPIGRLLLSADEIGLTGVWLEGEKYFAHGLPADRREACTPILADTKRWLDEYFSGKEPDFMPPLHPIGSPFRQAVWQTLRRIPYGKTVTYGEIAREMARQKGLPKMSAQAVGGAVGHNEISILIPCHRVVGAKGNLTGYAGGLSRKIQLLTLEGVDTSRLYIPMI